MPIFSFLFPPLGHLVDMEKKKNLPKYRWYRMSEGRLRFHLLPFKQSELGEQELREVAMHTEQHREQVQFYEKE